MEIIDLIIGAILAAIAGIAVPLVQTCIDNRKERQKIAKAFYNEVKTLQTEYSVGIPGEHLRKLGYLYPTNGLYFALRKEMYIFDTDLVEKLDRFYGRLTGVNANLRAHKEDGDYPDYDPMLKCAEKDADTILEQLKKYV